jgi:anti-sigma B factor antagonist
VYETEASDRSSETSRTGTGSLDEALFSYDIAADGGGVVVSMRGELDLASAPDLRRELVSLLARPVEHLTLDLGGVSFLDSSGLGALYRTRQVADERGVPLRLRSVPDHVVQVLDITAMAQLFDLEPPRP